MDEYRKTFKKSFDPIQADDALKDRTKAYLAAKTNGYRRGRIHPYRRIALVACFVLLLVAGGGYSSYFTLTSTISVDVNPSVELGINRYDRVISVRAFNEDGKDLLATKNVRFLDYREALRELLDAESMASYFAPDALIDITVFGTNDKKSNEILKSLENFTSHYDNVHCSLGSAETVSDAHSHGMSCGKYQAFLELQELDPSITAEEVQKLTMRQIRDRINELSKGAADDTSGDSNEHEAEHSDTPSGISDEHEAEHGNAQPDGSGSAQPSSSESPAESENSEQNGGRGKHNGNGHHRNHREN